MRKYKLTGPAKTDLNDIYNHILKQDPATAILVTDRIRETIGQICVFPRMGKLTTRPTIWMFGGSGKSPFRITYRFNDETVTVLRIFRSSRKAIQF